MILAVVDFVLVIILGLGAVKLIFPLIQDDFLWGMGIVLALLICIYVLVNLATYSFFYKGDLAQRKAMNQKIKELGRAFHAPSQGT
jgi:Tfp pilus assembly protein PilO